MKATIRPVSDDDWTSVAEIFNHFVTTSGAAYPDKPVADDFFLEKHLAAPGYPFFVADGAGEVVGFAYLSPFHSATTMKRSATLTYFIRPDQTGLGLGTRFLELLIEAGRELGIVNFLAHISSANEGSIRFHERHGFSECGRFLEVGEKNGHLFAMVWMQRIEG